MHICVLAPVLLLCVVEDPTSEISCYAACIKVAVRAVFYARRRNCTFVESIGCMLKSIVGVKSQVMQT